MIEVGVDVPNATVMVIEHAERFGLSQLHQLRGRIGRGGEKSTCILVAPKSVPATTRERLETMVRTNDGFAIAETDLRLRGPGEFFGTRQHGRLGFTWPIRCGTGNCWNWRGAKHFRWRIVLRKASACGFCRRSIPAGNEDISSRPWARR